MRPLIRVMLEASRRPRWSQTFHTITADPPWKFGDKLPGESRGAGRQYALLSAEQLCQKALDFTFPAVADDAVLFLWRVSAMVEEAYQVARAWGFVPKSEIVWRKQTKTGKRWFGMGRTVRAEHETCIIAVRGRSANVVVGKATRSTFDARVPVDARGRYVHSAKPEVFYTQVVPSITRGPYVELFARRQRAGWTCLGREAGA